MLNLLRKTVLNFMDWIMTPSISVFRYVNLVLIIESIQREHYYLTLVFFAVDVAATIGYRRWKKRKHT